MRRAPAGTSLLVSLIVLCFATAGGISFAIPLPSPNDFNFVTWELEHLPNKWLYLAGRMFDGRLSRGQEDDRLGRYLVLTAKIDGRQKSEPSADEAAQLRALQDERRGLKNDVEAILEGRVTAVLEQQGLASSFPLFPHARWVFPPVDTEIDQPPEVLSISRRDRIELIERRPLRSDLSAGQIAAEEYQVERSGTRSALVEPVVGVATYPSDVAPESSYRDLVDEVAHEWTHQYLFFKPLGRRFFSSLALQTLNETVATLSGDELAALVMQRYPLPEPARQQLAALAPKPPPIDVGAFLRRVRLDVDALLARGQTVQAEALMERKRQELASEGVHFRRINQAFFAAANIYATGPTSTDPIGKGVKELRVQKGSVGAFLRAAAELTGPAALDRLLASPSSGTAR